MFKLRFDRYIKTYTRTSFSVQEIETSCSNTISCAKLSFTGEQVGRLPVGRQQKVMPRTYQSPTVEGHLER